VDGEVFYDGKAVFGYFAAEALANQLGIDNGKITEGWHRTNGVAAQRIDLTGDHEMFHAPASKPNYRLAGGDMHFVDFVEIVKDGGKEGKGYIYAEKQVIPDDWFFKFHFHQDPVMPGSLGVEAMVELLQVWALQNDLGANLSNPRFSQIESTTAWKYRGQIIPTNKIMSLELHITEVRHEAGRVTVIADGNLWKDGIRIYELKDLAVCLEEQ
jgi:3-hydroxymyristoyl/3-hydroxydecanoyl-(acyl carrier protein) dehydratase